MASRPDHVNSGGAGGGDPPAEDLSFLVQKYEEEKEKRIRADGSAQYQEFESSEDPRLRHLADDPWVDHAKLNAQAPNLVDGQHVKVLCLGAGLGGIMYTTHLVETGAFAPGDIRLVDTAGGFGGTWYWNRFPGLACDVEASIYLPWLERTGYKPSHRYAHGDEIRRYIESVVAKWGLDGSGVFRTRIDHLVWDEDRSRWVVELEQYRGPDSSPDTVRLIATAQYVILANGVLSHPKAPKIDGLAAFGGALMHASRWDYGVSGGSPADPRLVGLEGKRVGVIGTAATGVQLIPELAKWAGELYVFQRTPSMVDVRGQREMTDEEWARITNSSEAGWWKKRNLNFNDAVCGKDDLEEAEGFVDLVADGWTRAPRTLTMLAGAPHQPLRPEEIPGHMQHMLVRDAPRSNGIRKRVEELVTKDKETAEALKSWYPTWCKRPCFHDTYLQTFNQPHVNLVPTDAKGKELQATPTGLVVRGKEYPLDVLVFATGYRSPVHAVGEPSAVSNSPITGRHGRTLASKWAGVGGDGEPGPGSLHGLFSHGFPNLVLTGPSHQALAGNVAYMYDVAGRHAAYILAEAEKRQRQKQGQVAVVEPSKEAEEAYIAHLASAAMYFAPRAVCTPGYNNAEGDLSMEGEDAIKAARATIYPFGINAWTKLLEEWRGTGQLEGINITLEETRKSP
ncbi:FAD-binding monooxygenase ausC [Apiospora arundinis]|uniref:FAD-binding monooxygenase ausC n=1 Tax=Apiospora arundinis TaxID=335852 RepID=A0ABR2JN60_9PEZI